jgi:hypothetical protein
MWTCGLGPLQLELRLLKISVLKPLHLPTQLGERALELVVFPLEVGDLFAALVLSFWSVLGCT